MKGCPKTGPGSAFAAVWAGGGIHSKGFRCLLAKSKACPSPTHGKSSIRQQSTVAGQGGGGGKSLALQWGLVSRRGARYLTASGLPPRLEDPGRGRESALPGETIPPRRVSRRVLRTVPRCTLLPGLRSDSRAIEEADRCGLGCPFLSRPGNSRGEVRSRGVLRLHP